MNQEGLYKIIQFPHVSEKASIAAEKNEYVFKVEKRATKLQIKQAIETLFNTKVKTVRVLNVKPKKKMFKGKEGRRQGWKKAYVTLQANQKLDIVGAQ